MDMAICTVLTNRRTLTLLFTLNLVSLGGLFLFMYDSNFWVLPSKHQKAYDRWRKIRENWHSFSSDLAKKEIMLQKRVKSQQMDAVVGFDFFNNAAEIEKQDNVRRQKEMEHAMRVASYNVNNPLNSLLDVPAFSDSDVVPYLSENISQTYLSLPNKNYSDKVAILIPVCNVVHLLKNLMKQLNTLTYPHHLLSVYFGEDSSADRTLDMATLIADDLKNKYGFNDSVSYHFNISGGIHGSWNDVHIRSIQYERRAHIAKARNLLLKVALKKGQFDYILWIDSDISTLPKDLIQQLMFAESDVVVPSCLFISGSHKRNFDKNSWRETPTSVEDQRHLPQDVLLVEGYGMTHRIYLPDLRPEGRVVPLDGVGGCTLLIRTKCHQSGLNFPEKVYSHHIETEGLAKMAKHMGYSVVGVPFVEVFHN